jgi:preprotein translocase subunit YajC
MKLILRSIAVLSMTAAVPMAPSIAQTAGQQVVDTSGAAVGSVVRVDGANVIVKTDKHEVALPKTSFTNHEGKLLFGMTQAQLNAEVDKQKAEAEKSIATGATVKGSGGTVVGTIDAVDAETVTVKLTSGALVRIPRSGIAAGNGEITIGLTAEELQAQAPAPTAQ